MLGRSRVIASAVRPTLRSSGRGGRAFNYRCTNRRVRLTQTLGTREFASNYGFAVSASACVVAPSKARMCIVPASAFFSRRLGLAHGVLGKLLSRLALHPVQFRQSLMLGRKSGATLHKAVFGWVVLRSVVPVCSVAVGLSRARCAQHFVQADVPDGPPLNSHVGRHRNSRAGSRALAWKPSMLR